MNKLRTLLATALLTLPVVTMASMPADSVSSQTRVEGTSSQTSCCMVLIMGRWYCIPC